MWKSEERREVRDDADREWDALGKTFYSLIISLNSHCYNRQSGSYFTLIKSVCKGRLHSPYIQAKSLSTVKVEHSIYPLTRSVEQYICLKPPTTAIEGAHHCTVSTLIPCYIRLSEPYFTPWIKICWYVNFLCPQKNINTHPLKRLVYIH